MTEIATLSLPCSAAALEKMMLRAAHAGHWHDAEVRIEDGNRLVIYHREKTAKVAD